LNLKRSSDIFVTLITFAQAHRLYTATEMDVARQRQYWQGSRIMRTKHSIDSPLSQTHVSLSLSLIQKQCENLLQDGEAELSLEDPEELAASGRYSCNPYDQNS
jgi:hypothetical protein